jgi:L-type amino acid transporter 9
MFVLYYTVLLASVNALSVRLASRVQVVFTAAKLLALVVIVIGGIVNMAQGQTSVHKHIIDSNIIQYCSFVVMYDRSKTCMQISEFIRVVSGGTKHIASGFEGTKGSIGPIALGLYNGMWAYDGW